MNAFPTDNGDVVARAFVDGLAHKDAPSLVAMDSSWGYNPLVLETHYDPNNLQVSVSVSINNNLAISGMDPYYRFAANLPENVQQNITFLAADTFPVIITPLDMFLSNVDISILWAPAVVGVGLIAGDVVLRRILNKPMTRRELLIMVAASAGALAAAPLLQAVDAESGLNLKDRAFKFFYDKQYARLAACNYSGVTGDSQLHEDLNLDSLRNGIIIHKTKAVEAELGIAPDNSGIIMGPAHLTSHNQLGFNMSVEQIATGIGDTYQKYLKDNVADIISGIKEGKYNLGMLMSTATWLISNFLMDAATANTVRFEKKGIDPASGEPNAMACLLNDSYFFPELLSKTGKNAPVKFSSEAETKYFAIMKLKQNLTDREINLKKYELRAGIIGGMVYADLVEPVNAEIAAQHLVLKK